MGKETKHDYKFLNNIDTPNDIKKLTNRELEVLCQEVRAFMIENVFVFPLFPIPSHPSTPKYICFSLSLFPVKEAPIIDIK